MHIMKVCLDITIGRNAVCGMQQDYIVLQLADAHRGTMLCKVA